eukprot:TRINITY_DN491_c0_g1_i1.p1 TRINITY_DN491_c0_g1~~TRINITY_DN491_c0_g1_i1.p1  ORF type:complete len:873 (-),score=139.97 TRINITY_DN491_c0_g1_i1:160-2724(-)
MTRAGTLFLCLHVAACTFDAVALPEPPCTQDVVSLTRKPLPRGVVSVLDFGADATGVKDSTAALQHALDAARHDNVTVFLPIGCYKVTDVLNATEPRNGRWQPIVVVGELPIGGDDRRPTLVLPPSTPGFDDPKKSRPVISFWTNWCLKPGPKQEVLVDASCAPGAFSGLPPYMFNMVFQGVNIHLHEGNRGAIGVNMLGAQGSTIQDVTVYAAPDALAGASGGCGGGGSFVGLKVVGARYGVDMRKTAGFATTVALTMVNQTCAGVLVGSAPGGSAHARSTTTMTGLRVEGIPRLAGLLVGLNLPKSPDDECWAPPMPGGWMDPPFVATVSSPENDGAKLAPHHHSLFDAVSLVDASFDVAGVPCVLTNGSIYISGMYATGCVDVVVAAGQTLVSATPASIRHIELLACGRQDLSGFSAEPFSYAFPTVVDGNRRTEPLLRLGSDTAAQPVGLQSRHHWGADASDWQIEGAVNALHVGVTGDGVTDDWAKLQAAIDAHDVVVLPKGFYRVSKPLVLRRRGVSLVGVGNARSFLMPLSSGFPEREQPVLDVDAKRVTVKSLCIVTWDHLDAYAVQWSGEDGLWRQAFANRENEAAFPPFSMPGAPIPLKTPPTNYSRPLIVISGGGAFYDFNLDFGCCFGTVVPPDVDVDPDIASTSEVLLQRPSYRTLLVNGSTSGLRFYQHNIEQDFGDAHSEVRWSTNVTMYGAKSEGNYVALWIRDSDLVTVHGYGGNAAPFPNATRYGPGRAQYMPSLFRVQRSSRVTLANIQNEERITTPSNPSTLIASGNGYDPRVYNMILHQDSDGLCDPVVSPQECDATRVLDRPVLWQLSGATPSVSGSAVAPTASKLDVVITV